MAFRSKTLGICMFLPALRIIVETDIFKTCSRSFLAMTIADLLALKPDTNLTVLNKPLTYVGTCTLALDGDGERSWLYGEDGEVIAVSVDDEEMIFFEAIDEELEPADGMVLYRGNEFEFSYEDAGAVTNVTGKVETEEDDRYGFSDYESDEGRVVRFVTNENTGEIRAYFGVIAGEDDITLAA